MRFLAIVPLLLTMSACAFDSTAWLERREDLSQEVTRLRKAYQQCLRDLQTPAEDVVLPVETFPDGAVKVSVQAKKVQYFLNTGLVWAGGVTVHAFKADKSLDFLLEAESCVIDRQTKSGWAEGEVTLTQGEMTFRGRGVYFSSPEEYVRIVQDTDLDLKTIPDARGYGGKGILR